jgi:hypothetical protein
MKRALVVLALLAASCASTPTAAPDARLAAVEQRLDSAPKWSLAFNTSTTGSIVSHFRGTMNVLSGNFASIDADGELRDKPVTIRWQAHGAPAQVSHALAITVVRLGITHTLAVLAEGGKMIEHAEGGVEEALKLTHVAWDEKAKKFTYHIVFGGQDVGEGELWVGRNDMPTHRKLTVHFPGGDMHCDERYSWR